MQLRDWKGRWMATGDFGARLCLRMDKDEAEQLRERAKAAGLSVSEYVRQLITREGTKDGA